MKDGGMGPMICGAAIFAVGCLFGAWLILAGQQSQKNKTGQKFQNAILKSMERK